MPPRRDIVTVKRPPGRPARLLPHQRKSVQVNVWLSTEEYDALCLHTGRLRIASFGEYIRQLVDADIKSVKLPWSS